MSKAQRRLRRPKSRMAQTKTLVSSDMGTLLSITRYSQQRWNGDKIVAVPFFREADGRF